MLRDSFKRLVIPQAVASEIGEVPKWVEIIAVKESPAIPFFPPRIHQGEAEVILAGLQNPGAILIFDDWYARQLAIQHGLGVIGTIGLVLRAKRMGQIRAISPIITELSEAGFRLSKSVADEARRLADE